tara:strand:- start:193 stop:561 length:369 start_codon:yes stop_codon:yes gene_type:complete
MNIKKIENISAIVIIVALFLPWISAGNSYMSVTISGIKAAGMGGAAVIIWLFPLLAIGVIVADVISNENLAKYLAIAAGILPLVYLLTRGGDFFAAAGIGVYLTIIASVAMLLGAFKIVKIP